MTLPAQSITVFSLTIDIKTSVDNVGANTEILNIFPTLVDNELNINGLTQNSSYQVFEMSGKKVMESNLKLLNIASLSKGYYVLRSTTGQVAKFIKK